MSGKIGRFLAVVGVTGLLGGLTLLGSQAAATRVTHATCKGIGEALPSFHDTYLMLWWEVKRSLAVHSDSEPPTVVCREPVPGTSGRVFFLRDAWRIVVTPNHFFPLEGWPLLQLTELLSDAALSLQPSPEDPQGVADQCALLPYLPVLLERLHARGWVSSSEAIQFSRVAREQCLQDVQALAEVVVDQEAHQVNIRIPPAFALTDSLLLRAVIRLVCDTPLAAEPPITCVVVREGKRYGHGVLSGCSTPPRVNATGKEPVLSVRRLLQEFGSVPHHLRW